MTDQPVLAIGLMSGTSYDGVDAALIETDGEGLARPVAARSTDYPPAVRKAIRSALLTAPGWLAQTPPPEPVARAAAELTAVHVAAVRDLLKAAKTGPEEVRVIGFHGQTVLHRPEEQRTEQIGEPEHLARETGIDVVWDLRKADVAAGGQGAPLLPAYHRALVAGLAPERRPEGPVAVVNIGGVSNVTYVPGPGEGPEGLLAFDCGPGNAPLNDWVEAHTEAAFDKGGALGARGAVDEDRIAAMLADPFFAAPPPKSLDRNDFTAEIAQGLHLDDGAATLTAAAAAGIAAAQAHLPAAPALWIVAGGGRHNPTLLRMLRERLAAPVVPAEEVGWRGDAVEAEGFAYLAVRSLKGLPVTFPGTTGVPEPLTGGRVVYAGSRGA